MKKLYILLSLFALVAKAQIINFPDANFKAKLLAASPSNYIAKNLSDVAFKIDSNNDGEIQAIEAQQVSYLDIRNSSIADLTGIGLFTNLQTLDIRYNQLTSLNLNGLTNLQTLKCDQNQLTSLNLTGLSNLSTLSCSYNQLTSVNITGLTTLINLKCDYNQLTSLSFTGLTNLITLDCRYNQLPSMNVTGLNSLKNLYCSNNQITAISLTGLTILETLDCADNQITSLILTGLNSLKDLSCSNNQLTGISLAGLTNLETLNCANNQIASLLLTGLIHFQTLDCSNNQITSLALTGLNDFTNLYCANNLITSLDISQNNYMGGVIDVTNNIQLTTLNLKNGNTFGALVGWLAWDFYQIFFESCPNLRYICADDFNTAYLHDKITANGYTNCHVNSYCTFTPGGTFYTIQGNSKYDENNNGCDVLDLPFSNLKFNITNGTNTGILIPNTTGNYNVSVQAGTHTLTPVFENPTYFNVSPTSAIITFPTQISPFTQNFCVTANGVHPDLEVTILPIDRARPGFDATYKIIYKNKGNTTQSGTVNLAFNDAVLDLVVANPVATTQTVNNLSWAFVNLVPFETREILVTLNVNSPLETPAVNSGDILNYTTTITSPATDDLPNDNTFVFNQTVVNSYDPNDKTCLEGATIAPEKVGDYVHYMIRFENNGTANAQNIVVKDMIDLAKFDINSIVPIKGSHSFVTNITAGNKVEFIFQNINLPFDDANNDGYVAFKIKTKSTLVLGNTFSNAASIYFDYNFPIVTNTATTTIAALSVQDFVFSNYFSVYPNPVHDVLTISSKESISVSSINIYNTLGQVVLVIPNAQNTKTVDVSSLPSGNYFIKINSDKGTSNTKFIKK